MSIATVTLDKLPVNTLNLELLESLRDELKKLQNENVRGMILTSGLKNVFSAGLDLKEFHEPDPTRLAQFWSTLQETWIELYLTPFPTVAVINGHCPAGGCLLAMSCDYRVMVEPKYTIGLNETQLGIVAPKWLMDTMIAVIGQRKAEVSLTTGKMYTAREALEIGLIDESAPDRDSALVKGLEFLNRFKNISQWAYQKTKETIRRPTVQWLIDNKQKDAEIILDCMQSPRVQKTIGFYLQSLKK
ncbi:enoyl-CoA delta isomerase 1, mitochondrial-like isoform X2 [Adelges cooleyi]|uniref:enoyl-CoA delta isomerase 1, mitochondrial-like isoform X2 n=1 Tax=Adelges cooleyi TaxID=133065 RepID=UPI0021803B71|nr:enoyl-CoA delta isomerase 1, mitochondrial-like isoform X2 [Adelges cooleyi]